MKKLTKNEIINLALESSAQATLPPDQLRAFDTIYELIKTSSLRERPWLFTLAATRDVNSTDKGGNRGFAYKYQLPKDTISVLSLNPSSTIPYSLSPAQGLSVGYAIDPYDKLSQTTQPKYIFVDDVLHTDAEVSEVIYKKDAPESEWTTDFALVVMWKLAEYIATSRTQKPALASQCKRNARDYMIRALRPLSEVGPVPVSDRALQHWLRAWYKAIYQQGA